MEGCWPGSPKQFNHVFSEQLFRLWDSVRKHMPGTSETAFLRSLGNISSERGRVCKYNLTPVRGLKLNNLKNYLQYTTYSLVYFVLH